MKAIILAAMAATLTAGAARADPIFNEEENASVASTLADERGASPDYAADAPPHRRAHDRAYGRAEPPVVHKPALEYGPFGQGSYAQPSYRTPDTTTLGTDFRGVTTYTVSPPPRAYPPQDCAYRPEYRRVHGRLVRIEPERKRVIHRVYDYRVVNGVARVVPPPCERVVGIVASPF